MAGRSSQRPAVVPTAAFFTCKRYMVRAALAFLLLISTAAQAEVCAFATFGLCHPNWPAEETIRGLDGCDEIHLSVLANSFAPLGTCPAFERLMRSPLGRKVRRFQLHVTNGPAQRGTAPRGGWEFIFDPRKPQEFSSYSRQWLSWFEQRLPKDTLKYVSPELESNRDQRTAKQMLDLAWAAGEGKWFAVHNPVDRLRGAAPIPATIYELHFQDAKLSAPCIWNNDGHEVKDSAPFSRFAHCEMELYWTHSFNGRIKDQPAPLPRARTAWPSRRDFARGRALQLAAQRPLPVVSRPEPRDVAGCKRVNTVGTRFDGERGFVWTQSDPSPNARVCGGKAVNGIVLLLPSTNRARRITAVQGGRTIEELCPAGRYTEDKTNRPLFRSTKYLNEWPAGLVLKADTGECWFLPTPNVRAD